MCLFTFRDELYLLDKPGQPGAPEIMGTDKSSVALKWTPPTKDGGAPVSFIIEYRRRGSRTWTRANSMPIDETTFSVTGLKEGEEYEFRVTAENKAGSGPASELSVPTKVEEPLGKCSILLLFFQYLKFFFKTRLTF